MSFKIVSDSSSDIYSLDAVPFASVPLKIITDEREYVDDKYLKVDEMIKDLQKYKGTSRSSCPNTNDWLEAFGDAENIFCVTITSGLSGSYNSAALAAKEYMAAHPERRVCVIDSLSAGAENALIVEKLSELINENLNFEEIENRTREYMKSTHLVFCLQSLKNLANNGRVSKAVAKVAGILGIRVIGVASLSGTLELTDKVRGHEKSVAKVYENMLSLGYTGGRVRIHYCENSAAAQDLSLIIKAQHSNAKITLVKTGALCSFYAEEGGLLIGFEGKSKY